MSGFVSERRYWEPATVKGTTLVEFPYYGFLEGFEVRFAEPQPNMNVGTSPYRAIVEVISPTGEHVKFQVLGMFRDVATPEEAARK